MIQFPTSRPRSPHLPLRRIHPPRSMVPRKSLRIRRRSRSMYPRRRWLQSQMGRCFPSHHTLRLQRVHQQLVERAFSSSSERFLEIRFLPDSLCVFLFLLACSFKRLLTSSFFQPSLEDCFCLSTWVLEVSQWTRRRKSTRCAWDCSAFGLGVVYMYRK